MAPRSRHLSRARASRSSDRRRDGTLAPMDQDLARTLDELERKLGELERTLGSLRDARGGSPSRLARRSSRRARAPERPEPHETPAPRTAPRDARAAEPDAPPPRHERRPTDRHERPAASADGRRRDGAGELEPDRRRGVRARAGRAHAARSGSRGSRALSARGRRRGQSTGLGAGPVAPSARVPRSCCASAIAWSAPRRDLTHDYDELLGRLSYAAVSAPPGPTISFARGAPSLDIVDVEGLSEAAARAFENDPARHDRVRHLDRLPAAAQLDRRPATASSRSQVLVTNGSMQADAFLFDAARRAPATTVIVERPTYDRTLLSLRQRGARRARGRARARRDRRRRAGATLLAGGVQPDARPHHPQLPEPGRLHAVGRPSAARLLELAAEHDFSIFEDDPYVALRFSGESLPTMLSLDPRAASSTRRRSPRPSARASASAISSGPRRADRADRQARDQHLHLAEHGRPVDRLRVLRARARSSARSRRSRRRSPSAPRRSPRRCARELPEARVRARPRAATSCGSTLPEGTDVAALFDAAAERGVAFVKGTDFLLEGGENTLRLAYSGVTPARSRGRRAAGRAL